MSSKQNKHWMKQHARDPYVRKAQQAGYRSRAVYKLIEIQEKDRLLKPGMLVIDLGAAPGSWSQFAKQCVGKQGMVIAVDRLKMDPLPGVEFILGDMSEQATLDQVLEKIAHRPIDLVFSDMAPNISGNQYADQAAAAHLARCVLSFAEQVLRPGGGMLLKVFHGSDFTDIVGSVKEAFDSVVLRKPKASRGHSKETYLLARGYNLTS